MNKTYRLVFNEITGAWIAVAEHVKTKGKRSASAVMLSAASLLLTPDIHAAGPAAPPPAATQLPTGGQVSAGQATISQTTGANSAVMNIDQSTQRAAINWSTFNLGSAGTVNFNQPGAQSVTLNRVNDTNPSQIFGKINAPGTVWLMNPNGVYFGASSSVDVGSFAATTHRMSDADFMAGKTTFDRNGALGSVVNDGELKAKLDGYIALMAPEVRNQGVVIANRGTAVLAAGEAITLDFDAASKLSGITVRASEIATLIENKHAIETPDGQIILSAQSANQLRQGVVRNSGSLLANTGVNTITHKGGRILLEGDDITLSSTSKIEAKGEQGGGTVLVGGDWQGSNGIYQAQKVTMETGASIDASATQNGDGGKVVLWSDIHDSKSVTAVDGAISAKGGTLGGNGGQIETSGYRLNLDKANVSASAPAGVSGEWLIDPFDVNISATGASGTAYNANYTPTAASTILASSIVGSLNANTNVSITTGSASSNTIYVNTGISATGTGSLTLTGQNIQLGADITTGGAQVYNGAVILTGSVNLTTTNSRVRFVSTVDSDSTARALTIAPGSGSIYFGGAIGASSALSSLAVNGASSVTGVTSNITTTGAMSFAGDLVLYGSSVLSSTNSDVAIAGQVKSPNTAALIFVGSGGYYENGVYNSVGSSPIYLNDPRLGSISYTGGSYSWNPIKDASSNYLLTGGGGGGAGGQAGWYGHASFYGIGGGGGGGGQVLTGAYSITSSAYSITIGSGGGAGGGGGPGGSGNSQQFGSSGGAGGSTSITGIGIASGGSAGQSNGTGGSANGGSANGGSGSNGTYSSISGVGQYYGSGAGAGNGSGGTTGGTGGSGAGSGGNATGGNPTSGGSGSANLGGGGGGGGGGYGGNTGANGGSGGSGTAIISLSYIASGITINAGTGKVTLSGGAASQVSSINITSSNTASEISGAINGSTSLTYTGAGSPTSGVLTLSSANSYTGTTTINSGTIAVTNSNALGDNSGGVVTVGSGAILDIRNVTVGVKSIVLAGGSLISSTGTASLSGNIVMNADSSIGVSGSQLTLSGSISGVGYGITKTGSGNLLLSGNNSYTGNTVATAGTLAISSGSSNVAVNNLQISASANVDLRSSSTFSVGNLTIASGGYIKNTSGAGSLYVSGTSSLAGSSTAAVATSGPQTYVGAITLIGDTTLSASNSAITFNSSINSDSTSRALTLAAGSGQVSFGSAIGSSSPLASLVVSGSGSTTAYGNITTSGSMSFGGDLTVVNTTSLTTTNSDVTVTGKIQKQNTYSLGLDVNGLYYQNGVSGTATSSSVSLTGAGMGTLTYSGGSYTWTPTSVLSLNYLLVAGGGGGAGGQGGQSGNTGFYGAGGGGGAGGQVLGGTFNSTTGAYTITIGSGGSGGGGGTGGSSGWGTSGSNGTSTTLSGVASATGGVGGSWNGPGGAGSLVNNNGGAANAGAGGAGIQSALSGSTVIYGAGAGAGTGGGLTIGGVGGSGAGSGGNSSVGQGLAGGAGTANVGGGGGGGGGSWGSYWGGNGAAGGSGTAFLQLVFPSPSVNINAGSGRVTLSGGASDLSALNITSSNSGSLVGTITGAGILTFTGAGTPTAGTLALSGTNTYTGTTTVNSGTLKLSGSGTLGSGDYQSTLTVASGATFENATSATQKFSGTVTGPGNVNQSGSGTFQLTGTATYSGSTSITAGIYKVDGSATLGSEGSFSHGITIGSGGAFIYSSSSDQTLSGVISNSGNLTVSGTGALILSGTNTFAGSTSLNSGTLVLGSAGAIGDSGIINFNGGILKYSVDNTIDYTARFSNNSNQFYKIDVPNSLSVKFSTALSSSGGSLFKYGEGILELDASNTFIAGNKQAGLTGSYTGWNTPNTYQSPTLTYTSPYVAGTDTIAYLTNLTNSYPGVSFTFKINSTSNTGVSGQIVRTDTGGSDGTYQYGGTITYTVVPVVATVNAGTLKLGITSSLNGNGGIRIAAGGHLDLNGKTQTGVVRLDGGTITNNAANNVEATFNGAIIMTADSSIGGDSGNITVSNFINNPATFNNALTLQKVGSNTVILQGNNMVSSSYNAYLGNTKLSGGFLQLEADNAIYVPGQRILGNTSFLGGGLKFSSNNSYDYSNSYFSSEASQVYRFDTNGQSVSLGGALTSSGGSLYKYGSGTLTLNNTNNSYAGGTTINGGTLKLGASGVLADTGSVTLANQAGAVLDINGKTETIGWLSGGGAAGGDITLGSGALTVTQSADKTFGGVMSGTGSFTKNGSATLELSGANTFTGGTTINTGVIKVSNATALGGDIGSVSVASGAAIDLNGTTMTGTNALTLRGTGISSSGALYNSSTTDATYAGLITLGASSSIVGGSGSVAITNTGTIGGSGYGLTLGGASGGSVASIIGTGTGTLTKADAGIWTLSAANTYTGATAVNAGTLKITNDNALGGTGGATTVASGAVLDLHNVSTAEPITLNGGTLKDVTSTASGAITLTADSFLTATNSGDVLNITGGISGTGYGVTIGGNGKVVIGTAAATYTGATLVNSGTLQVTSGLSNSTAVSVAAGATYQVSASDTIGSLAGAAAVTGASPLAAASVVLDSGLTLSTGASNSSTTMAGVISGSGALTKVGTGTFTLSGANTYAGATTVSAGTLAVASGGTLGSGSAVTVSNPTGSATLDLQTGVTIGSLVMSGTTPSITNSTGTSSLTVSGTSTLANSVTTSGAQTYTGAVTLGANTSLTATTNASDISFGSTINGANALTIATNAAANTTFSGIVGGTAPITGLTVTSGTFTASDIATASGSAVSINVSGDSGGSLISGVISGASTTFSKSGLGTLLLGAVNTYTGATSVNAGILMLGVSDPFAGTSSAITVSSGATLDLNGGSIDNAVSVQGVGFTPAATSAVPSPLPIGALYSSSGQGTIAGDVTIGGTTYVGGGSLTGTTSTGGVAISGKVLAGSHQISFIGAGNYSMTKADNEIATIAAYNIGGDPALITGVGSLNVVSKSDMTLGSVSGSSFNGIASVGNVILKTTGSLTIGSGQQIGSTNGGIALTTSKFVNNGGLDGLTANTNWTVLSTNASPFSGPGMDVDGGVAFDYKQYNVTSSVWAGTSPTGTHTGNGLLYSYAPKINVTLGTPATAISKVYDGNTNSPTLTAGNYAFSTAGVNGDKNLSISIASTGTYDSANVLGASSVTVTGVTYASGLTSNDKPVYGYKIADSTGTLPATAGTLTGAASITPKSVTLAGTKTYDGTTDFTNAVTIGGLVGSQTLNYTGTTASGINVGSNYYINAITLTDGSGLASNYALPNLTSAVAGNTASVTPKTVTISSFTVANKTYDGNASATITNSGSIQTGVGSETLTLGASGVTATFASKNSGTQTVTATGYTLADGTGLASNYSLANNSATTTGTISPKALSITGQSANAKTYDGTNLAILSGGALSGVVSGDTVSLAQLGAFASANVAYSGSTVVAQSVVPANTITGADVGNYTLTQPSNMTAMISPAAVTVSGVTASDKVYNGSSAATMGGSPVYTGLVAGESLTLATSNARFVNGANQADANAANNKTVLFDSTFTAGAGTLLGNYSITPQTSATASITPRAITISSLQASNKVYDGNTTAVVPNATVNTGVGSESIVVSATGAFADKNVADNKSVSLTSTYAAGSGTSLSNYSITSQATSTANITPKNVTISGVSASDKVYDGTTTATVNTSAATLVGLVAGDAVSLNSTTGTFSDANVAYSGTSAIAKDVSLNIVLGGTDKGNYSFALTPTVSAKITPAALTITANNDAKLVGSATTSGFNGVTYSGLVGSEQPAVLTGTLAIARSSASEAPGTYTLTPSGLSSGNYSISYNTGAYTIVPADQILVKVANQTLQAGNGLTYGSTPAYSITSAQYLGTVNGSQQVVNLQVTNNGNNNYTFTDPVANASASFTIAPVNASTSTAGFIQKGSYQLGTGNVSLSSGSFFNSNVVLTGAMDVAAKVLTAGVASADKPTKVYDGTTAISNVNVSLTGAMTGDLVSGAAGAASYASANAGTAVGYTASNITLTGSDAANYTLNGVDSYTGTNGVITPKALSVTGVTAQNRAYDGTQNATVNNTGTISGLVAGESISMLVSAGQFADKNVGNVKSVSFTSSYTAGGNTSLNNYSITDQLTTTANITPKVVAVSAITANNKAYDGTVDAVLANQGSITTGIAGETISVSSVGTFADKNVGTSKDVNITSTYTAGTGTQLSNYTITGPATAQANITPKDVTLSGSSAVNKVYDGTTNLSMGETGYGSLSGVLAGDTVSVSGTAIYDAKDAGSRLVQRGNVALSGSGAANYNLLWTDGSGTISKAPLTISANNFAKLVGQTDTANYGGVSYTGLVNGETSSVINTTSLVVNRTGTETATGTYNGVLLPAGATSGNYDLTYTTGNLQIVGYNQLLVKFNNASTTYGTAASYALGAGTNAQYVTQGAGGNPDVFHNVTASLDSATRVVTVTDPSATNPNAAVATFELAPLAQVNSGASQLAVGNYELGARNATIATTDVGSNIVLNGTLSVTQKALSASVAAPSKTYDGTTTMNGVSVLLSGLLSGDAVTASASGSFADKNVGAGKSYNVIGTAITGNDAGNYYLTSSSFSGNNGLITPKSITVSGITAANKVYDGNTSATVDVSGAQFNGLIAGESIGVVASGVFNNKNAGVGKTVTLSSSYSGAASNYDITDQLSTTANISPKAITVSGITALDKVYDGTTTASVSTAGIQYSNGGFITGDAIAPTVTGAFLNKNAAAGKTVNLSTSWTADATTLANYSITDQATATADITKRVVTLAGSNVTKTYDGTTNMLTGVSGYGALGNTVAGDTVSVSGKAAFADANSGNQPVVQGSAALVGSDAGNYQMSWTNGSGTIDKAALTITANKDARFIGMADTAGYQGVSYTGFVNGETASVLTALPTVSNSGAGNQNVAQTYQGVLSASGAAAANYTINYVSNDYRVIPADQLLVKVANVANTYGDTPTYTIKTAAYVAESGGTQFTLMDLTSRTAVTVNNGVTHVKVTGLYGSSAEFDLVPVKTITGAGITNSTTGNLKVDNYELGAANLQVVGNNFSQTVAFTGVQTVNPLGLTATALSAPSKVYDGTVALPGSINIGLSGLLSSGATTDAVSATAVGTFTNKNVGTNKSYDVSNITLSGTDAGNYFVTNNTYSGTNGVITPKALSISGLTAASKTYDGTTNAAVNTTQAAYSGLVAGDDVTVQSTGAFLSKHAGSNVLVNLSNQTVGADVGNYTISTQASTTADIFKKVLTVSGVTASDKVYDSNTQATIQTTGAFFNGLVGAESISVNSASSSGTFVSKNAATNALVGLTLNYSAASGTNLADYDIQSQTSTTASITPKTVTLAGLANINKTYDGTTNLPVTTTGYGTLGGVVSGDTVTVFGRPLYDAADAGSRSVTQGSVSLTGADATNYALNWTNGSGTIAKAALTVTANNDAKFYGQLDNPGYQGVSYTGFVNGETAASAGLGGTLAVNRSNASTQTAGNYSGVLQASGLTANNYTISYVNGDYTIVPAGQLLVKVGNVSNTYGSSAPYVITSAQYMQTSGNAIVDVTSGVSYLGNNQVQINDTVNGYARFTIVPQNPVSSSAGLLSVGNYQFTALNVSENSANFSNTVTITGAQSVTQRQLTPSVTSPTMVYNGSTAMVNASIGLSGVLGVDAVTANGVGTYAGRNVGAGNIAYTVDNVALSGADSGNYFLTSNSFTGTNGTITPKVITLSTPDVTRVYNGTTGYVLTPAMLTALGAQLGVAGDGVSSASLTYDNKNAGTGKTVTLSNALISDGNGGNNYQITYAASTQGVITALGSVTWVGGATGNWFDANNWLGGLVPDLANIASVIIPTGVNQITFNNALATAPTDPGPVQTSFQGAPSSLAMVGGSLAVGNSLSLTSFTQSGGSFSTGGNFTTASFSQTAGTTGTTSGGDFTVTDSFSQSGTGSLNVSGATNIHQASGPLVLGNITSTGALSVVSAGGPITQQAGSVLNPLSTSSFAATNGASPADITLTNAGNDFASTVSTSGNNIALADGTGGVVLGQTTATGTLGVTSTGGGISQVTPYTSGNAITTGGTASFTASSGSPAVPADVTLVNPYNVFGGNVSVTGANVAVVDSTPLSLGSVSTTGDLSVTGTGGLSFGSSTSVGGDLTATSGNGDITQTGPLTVVGTSNLSAGTGSISLTNPANDFVGPVATSGNNIALADGTGGVVLGQTTATGTLGVTSTGGGISQEIPYTSSNAITTGGTASFAASSGNPAVAADVTVVNPYNVFGGNVSVTGANVAVVDSTPLTLGSVSTTGDLSVTGTGGLSFGTSTSVGGDLTATSGNGDITQVGPVTVVGSSDLTAGTGSITLTNPDNDFGGVVSTSGNNIALADGTGGVELGKTTATGKLDVISTDGTISQESPYTSSNNLDVGGAASFAASSGNPAVPVEVSLDNPSNIFRGPVTGLPSKGGDKIPSLVVQNDQAKTKSQEILDTGRMGGFTAAVPKPVLLQVMAAAASEAVPAARAREAVGEVSLTVMKEPGFTSLTYLRAAVPTTMADAFSFTLPTEVRQSLSTQAERPSATQLDNQGLPGWLKFDSATQSFTAESVPSGGLPLKVQVVAGAKRVVIELTQVSLQASLGQ